MVRIQQSKRKQNWITIPKNVMELLGWKKGDEVIFGMDQKRRITLTRQKA